MMWYSEAEMGMLLLFAPIAEEKALTPGIYRKLECAAGVLGMGDADPARDVSEDDLTRLGMEPQDAKILVSRLGRRDALTAYLAALERQGITVLTRLSPGYPARLRKVLGSHAPMLLFCAGNLSLFDTRGAALVGSRKLREPGRRFAQKLGAQAAAEKFTYVSGGAAGADTVGFDAAMRGGGSAVVFLADSLEERMRRMKGELATGRTLLVSEYGHDQPFSVPRAYSRNRLIHAMGEKVFVAQSDYGTGGTWNGVIENLKAGWSPCFMCDMEPENPGAVGLIERGCTPAGLDALDNLSGLREGQTRMF